MDPLTTRLEGIGFDPEDAVSRAALIGRTDKAFSDRTGHPPAWRWFVPGRIEVFGKHTDYAGGRSLLAAVPRGFAVSAAPRADGRISVVDARYGGDVTFDPLDPSRVFTGWTRYVAVVGRRLASNFPGADLGADIAMASDLPRAAGVSSSSALVVGIATALIERAGLTDRVEWLAAIHSPEDLAGYLGAVENGLTFGPLAGTSGVGTYGGSEDHTAILLCHAGAVSMYAYVPVQHLGDEMMPADWRFIVMSSGIEADKAGSAMDRYNRASLATRAILDVWNSASPRPAPTLAALLSAQPDAATELGRLFVSHPSRQFSPDDLSRRLAHFIAEDGRVPLAALAVRRADTAGIGDLARASQDEADRWLGNQIPETRGLAELARTSGAFAASSFGAGFGGSVWALAHASEADDVCRRWAAAYQGRFAGMTGNESFVAKPAPGLTRL